MTPTAMTEELGTAQLRSPVPDVPADERRVIETRFGTMEFAPEQAISMPRGVLGFAEHREFGLTYLPNKFIDQLMLLQSYADPETSFLVLPMNIDAGIIDEADLVGACATMNVAPENAVIAVIVTIRDVGGEPQITTNLRAPIILDAESRNGWQYVLPNGKYSVRHNLNIPAAADDVPSDTPADGSEQG